MGKLGVLLLVALLFAGCTRVVDDARPLTERPVAPIAAGQVDDLLSENAKPDDDPNPFVTVEPEKCEGVAREVDAPFIFDAKPAAHSGGDWYAETAPSASIVEIIGVYHADYDPRRALDGVKRVIESCRDNLLTVTASRGQILDFRLLPSPVSGVPEIVLWSMAEPGRWACDNAFVAAHNAAIEITACAEANGFDVLSLAKEALKRIQALANATV